MWQSVNTLSSVLYFPFLFPLCFPAQHQLRRSVNGCIDLLVCFPILLPFFLQMNCHIPLSINPVMAICPTVSDAKFMTALLNPHFPPNRI